MPKTRRKRTAHPGVKLTKRKYATGGTAWRGIYDDPDTGKRVAVNLNRLGFTDAAGRRKWAINRSRQNAARRAAIERGDARRRSEPIADLATEYDRNCKARLRERTAEGYKRNVDAFVAWLSDHGVTQSGELDSAVLTRFRDHVVTTKKSRATSGGRQGERERSAEFLAPSSANRKIREAKTFVNFIRARGLCHRLTSDDVRDSLKPARGPKAAPEPLTAAESGDLLSAALQHDLATFKLTREEHAANPSALAVHGTRRHTPIAPFLLFVLLTGCRLGEALELRWDGVDLNAPDDYGNAAGEIRLRATATKTHAERRIDLAVCPSLRTLLAALALRRGEDEFVFGGAAPLGRDVANNARARLVRRYEAPAFNWQRLRQTCASFLTNAPGIYKAASIYRSAEQLGHSPDVANKHYLGRIRGIPETARTLEAALKIEKLAASVVALATGADPATLDLDRGAA